eukprot:5791397-Alexandrium_andersonii.AAC.1
MPENGPLGLLVGPIGALLPLPATRSLPRPRPRSRKRQKGDFASVTVGAQPSQRRLGGARRSVAE